MNVKHFLLFILIATTTCQAQSSADTMTYEINKSEEEWKRELTPEQYRILRQKGTEMAHTGKYNLHFEEGFYTCAGCGERLFDSETKFESHCGWPSFFDAAGKEKIKYVEDRSHGMIRTEIVCAKCGGHLGHVFDDGPAPTGQRYCVNSGAINFVPEGADDDGNGER